MPEMPKPRRKLSLDDLVSEPASIASPEPESAVEKPSSKTPSYRKGKRAFTAWARVDAYEQLRIMAITKKTTVQALLEEGMDLVFEKHGYDQIARKS